MMHTPGGKNRQQLRLVRPRATENLAESPGRESARFNLRISCCLIQVLSAVPEGRKKHAHTMQIWLAGKDFEKKGNVSSS
jgi:hypothetical protein